MTLPGPLERLLLDATGHLLPLRALVYLKEVRRLRRGPRDEARLLPLLRAFPAWERTLRAGRSALDDEVPWMSTSAARHLCAIVDSGARVYEYGAGGSTLFLARRVREGASVEHDGAWAQLVAQRLRRAGLDRWRVDLVEPEPAAPGARPGGPDPARPEHYASDDGAFRGRSFRAYATSIERYPEGHFDLVVVDGRARPSCALHGAARVRPGGHLLLDNCERPHYQGIFSRLLALGWEPREFGGPVPYSVSFSRSCFFRRRAR